MGLLARRDYARFELAGRLQQKGHPAEVVEGVLAALTERGYLSDERFTEGFVRSRQARGYGPVRIRAELNERRVDAEAQAEVIEQQHWVELAREARRKRFGDELPQDMRERMKQMRFLQYRGFSAEQIKAALRCDEME